ncbi:MAG: rod shape-determining protein [Desulfobacterales bacterium]|nr:rod shape-determining protein [Desulfobacterales bacterium]
MIDLIINRLFKNTIYVEFSDEWISVKHVETGNTIEDKPLLAVKQNKKGKNIVFAIGAEVEQLQNDTTISIHNGFSHPRVCINDFEIAQATLMHFIRKALNKKILIRPIMIMHPKGNLKGGLSQIEDRAIKELATASGAQKCYVWVGRRLKEIEMISLNFPTQDDQSILE